MKDIRVKKKKFKKPLTLNERNLGTFQKNANLATIYIGNLRYTVKEKAIKRMFERHGEVTYVKLICDPKTERSKGIAFVQMPDKQKANDAITTLNGREVNGRTLKVSIAKDSEVKSSYVTPENKEKLKKELDTEAKTKKPVRRKRDGGGLKVLFDYLNA